LVLAAGDGRRLQGLTVDSQGRYRPKQYWSFEDGGSLLAKALDRAGRILPKEQAAVVVAADHQNWWQQELSRLPSPNLIVQPSNRGTAIGILLPLLTLMRRDPDCGFLVLPSDHHVAEEYILAAAARTALSHAEHDAEHVFLLGITPEEPDPDLGWIVPGPTRGGFTTVERFIEKPSASLARSLFHGGGIWNSFLFAASGRALLALFVVRLPNIVSVLRRALARDGGSPGATVSQVYRDLPIVDFSQDVLQGCEERLRVQRVAACGWSDLGTPARVERVRRRRMRAPKTPPARDEDWRASARVLSAVS
jgi:mannose-1-phosphate guanylyltransferase